MKLKLELQLLHSMHTTTTAHCTSSNSWKKCSIYVLLIASGLWFTGIVLKFQQVSARNGLHPGIQSDVEGD